MAERWAVATGNWSAVGTWDGGAALPTTGDTVHANTYTVTIDQDITVGSIRTLAGTTPVAGGGFAISSSRTLTCNIVAGSTDCLTVTGTPTVTIVGDITGGASTNADGMVCVTGATINITGNVTGGSGTTAYGIYQGHASNSMTIIGNVLGGSGNGAKGIYSPAALSLTVTGSVTGGSNASGAPVGIYFGTGSLTVNTGPITGGTQNLCYGIEHSASTATLIDINCDIVGGTGSSATGCVISTAVTTMTVDGNMTGGTVGVGLHFNITGSTCTITGNALGSGQYGLRFGAGTVNMTGNATAGTTNNNGHGIVHDGTGTMTLTGNVLGSTNASYTAVGYYYSGAGVLTINGDVTAGAGGNGLYMTSATALATINGTVTGNARGTGSTDTLVYGVNYTPTPTSGYCKVRSVRCGANGMWPISGPVFISNIHQASVKVRNSLLNEGRYTLNRVTKGTVMGGDYQVGDVIYLSARFRTTPAGSPAVTIYADGSNTPITTGVSLDYSGGFGGLAGLVMCTINTASGYTAGKDYVAVMSAGTVYGDSIVGEVIGSFSLAKQSIKAVKAKTDNLPSDPADASDIAATLATISGYTDTVETGIGTIIADTTTIKGYLDTEILAIKAKTDTIPSDPADASDIAAAFATVNSTLSTISGYTDTLEATVGAIKVKTDNLPVVPASQDDCVVSAALVPAAVTKYNLAGSDAGLPLLSPWNMMRHVNNRWTITGISGTTGTLTVYKEDGTTPAYTREITFDDQGRIVGQGALQAV